MLQYHARDRIAWRAWGQLVVWHVVGAPRLRLARHSAQVHRQPRHVGRDILTWPAYQPFTDLLCRGLYTNRVEAGARVCKCICLVVKATEGPHTGDRGRLACHT